MKFRAEIEVELPEDLYTYVGATKDMPLSYVQGLAKMHLTIDINNALHHYGMDGKTIGVVKAHS